MTSQLNVDTIVDKAGSGGTNVKVGNTSTYVADGGSATQNLVQGLAKCWITFGNDAVADDSLNIASTTDIGTGQWRQTKTNVMANTTYTVVASSGYLYNDFNTGHNSTAVESTSNHTQAKYQSGVGFQDFSSTGTAKQVIHGDLA